MAVPDPRVIRLNCDDARCGSFNQARERDNQIRWRVSGPPGSLGKKNAGKLFTLDSN